MIQILATFILFLVFFIAPLESFCEERIRFRHRSSLYMDNAGFGLKHPEGITCKGDFLIVGDTENDRLLYYTLSSEDLVEKKVIKVPQLARPIRIQMNSKGETLALDGNKRRILFITPEGTFKGYLEPKGLPKESIIIPKSFRVDKDDNIYVLDIFSGRVLVVNPEGEYQKAIPFPRGYGFFSDLALNTDGVIFLIDSVNAMVFSNGKDPKNFSPFTKSLEDHVDFPTSILLDAFGLLYLVDQNGGRIVVLNPDGSFKESKLGNGFEEGLLNYPSQMCISEQGMVFIADRNNNRVQVLQ